MAARLKTKYQSEVRDKLSEAFLEFPNLAPGGRRHTEAYACNNMAVSFPQVSQPGNMEKALFGRFFK